MPDAVPTVRPASWTRAGGSGAAWPRVADQFSEGYSSLASPLNVMPEGVSLVSHA